MVFDLNTTANQIGLTPETVQTGNLDNLFSNIDSNAPTQEPKSSFDSGEFRVQRYNGLDYEIQLFLDNSGNFDMKKKKQYLINPQAVINLTVVDTVNDWVVDGNITFLYTPGKLPAGFDQARKLGQNQKTLIDGAKENSKLLDHYEFRGDGYDMLRFYIRPVARPSNLQDKADLEIEKNDPRWMLSYLFSVYETEDLNDVPVLNGATSTYLKCMRLKFHDMRYQMLKTTNLEYSTANSPQAEYVPGLANDVSFTGGPPRALKTGVAMFEVFQKALADPQQFALGNTSIEFTQQLDEDWDPGEDSKLFYTSPASYTAQDDIDYLFANHLGPKIEGTDTNDICVLHTIRSEIPGGLEKISLTPLSKIFEKATDVKNPQLAGELLLEHFFVTNHTKYDENMFSPTYKSPDPKANASVLKTFKYGQILSYSFVDMSPDVNSSSFITTPVYSVDIGKRQFNIQFKNNDVMSARKTIAEGYIKHLYKESADLEQLFLPVIHNSKKDLNVMPSFSLNGDNLNVRQRNGIHRLMYTGIFQNACICFRTLGLTLRESGTFIAIDETNGTFNSDYNNKLYGQYFVVKVDHVFEQGIYVNNIWAVKIHRFKNRVAEFDNTDFKTS